MSSVKSSATVRGGSATEVATSGGTGADSGSDS